MAGAEVREHCAKSIHCVMGFDHEGRCRDAATTASGATLDPMWLRIVRRDGDDVILARCPSCGSWAELDDDQLHGRVSTHHDVPECGYHETKNWWADHVA